MQDQTAEDMNSARDKDCLQKLTWPTHESAIAARAYAGWQYGDSASRPRPYLCRHCELWHLARHRPD